MKNRTTANFPLQEKPYCPITLHFAQPQNYLPSLEVAIYLDTINIETQLKFDSKKVIK